MAILATEVAACSFCCQERPAEFSPAKARRSRACRQGRSNGGVFPIRPRLSRSVSSWDFPCLGGAFPIYPSRVFQNPLSGEPVVCTPHSRGFRHFRGCRDFRYSSTQLLGCSCLSRLRHFRDFHCFREMRPACKTIGCANHRFRNTRFSAKRRADMKFPKACRTQSGMPPKKQGNLSVWGKPRFSFSQGNDAKYQLIGIIKS